MAWEFQTRQPDIGMYFAKDVIVVFSFIKLFPSLKQRAELVEILRSVQNLTRPSQGCVQCWLSEADVLPVCYLEQWQTEEALNDHIRSALYGRVLAALELSSRAPEVRFYFASEDKGLELVETVRGAKEGLPRETS